jgi:hypothetical protein
MSTGRTATPCFSLGWDVAVAFLLLLGCQGSSKSGSSKSDPCGVVGDWNTHCESIGAACTDKCTFDSSDTTFTISPDIAAKGGTWQGDDGPYTFAVATCTLTQSFESSTPCFSASRTYSRTLSASGSSFQQSMGCYDDGTGTCWCIQPYACADSRTAGGSNGGTGGGMSGGGATGSGGAPGAGGSTTSPDAAPGVAEADEAAYILSQVALVKNHQSADFNHDGQLDCFVSVLAGGTIRVALDLDQDGTFELVEDTDPSGNRTTNLDPDEDGTINRTITKTIGPPLTTVDVLDSDGDGTMDTRTTMTVTGTNSVHVLVETDPQETGTFTKTEEFDTVSWQSFGQSKCPPPPPTPPTDPNATPPDQTPYGFDWSDKAQFTMVRPGFQILTSDPDPNNAGLPCNAAAVETLTDAIDCAVDRMESCLRNANASLYNSMRNAEGGVQIGCGNHIDPTTVVTTSPDESPPRISFNMPSLLADGVDSPCGILMHELMHAGGYPLPAHCDDDEVYACGFYCDGCPNGSSNKICTRCMDNADKAVACGYQNEQAPGAPWFGICHAGLGCIAGPCNDVVAIKKNLCDGTVIASLNQCCHSCPADCNESNDFPCDASTNLTSVDTCSTPVACPMQ